MAESTTPRFSPFRRDHIQQLNLLDGEVAAIARNTLPGILTSTLFQMSAGIASYTLPHVAIVSIHQAFLNGVKTTVSLSGNVVTATQFAPLQYSAADELEILYFI